MRLSLKRHAASLCEAVEAIEVEVTRTGAVLELHYCVGGTIADLAIPAPGASERRNELWQHTCFEAFVRAGDEQCYAEFNFAPSTAWAAYRFDGYRSGMRDASEISAPRMEVRSGEDRLELRASLELASANAPWQLGLSAVIEERSGRKSYWALAHPPGAPDFHHEDCFALQLPPAD